MGKSSLLNAGVMHRLRARGYWPVNVRLNDTTLSPVQSIDRQIAQADIRDTEVEVQRTPGLDFDITADTTLWDLLGSLEVWRGDRLQQLVVVLDQFEELFTLDWKADVRDRFIAEFGQVVRGHRSGDGEALAETSDVPVPSVKFCIVIREDALGQLEALADDVPQIMQNRFRLGALDATQAELAIREPAMVDDGLLDTQPFEYSEAAARQILDFLQETERAAMLHLGEVDTDTSVDPSQLQIICQYIERRVLPAKGIPPDGQVVTIATDDLGGAEGLRSVLGDFYRRTVGTFPPATQRLVQRLCEEGLISRSGRRLSIERDEIAGRYEVSQAILDELVDQRLLRVEPRVGSAYYELSHDTLVRPILADRADRRQATSSRRRRFAFVAAGVVALIVLAFFAYRLGFDEGSESVASIEFETPLQREVEQAGDVARFQAIAREQPSLVVVEPSEDGSLNASVSLTNSKKTRREADQLRSGEAERIVVPAGTGDQLDVAVSSKDASTGGFEITQGDLTVTPLLVGDSGDDPVRGSIDEPGSLAVYSVDVTEPLDDGSDTSIEIFVSRPDEGARPNGKKDAGLDVEIEVIDPTGAGTVTDLAAAGQGERTTLSGGVGQYLVVVRGYLESTGGYEITASYVDYATLPLDETADGEIESADASAAFAINVPVDGDVSVIVTSSGDLDPVLEIVDPGGDSLEVDSSAGGEAELAELSGGGLHLVHVSGYDGSVGTFDIVAEALQTAELDEDASVSATAPVAFEVEVDTGEVLSFNAESEDPDSVLIMQVIDPEGIPTGFGGGGLVEGQPATAVLDGTFPGSYTIIVGSAEPGIDITATLQPIESQQLLENDPVTVPAPAGFDVDVIEGQSLIFTAQPESSDSVLDVSVQDADGNATGSSGSSPSAGEPATVTLGGGLPGHYRIIVNDADASTDVTATLQPAETKLLTLGSAPVDGVAPAIFDIDLAAGERALVVVTPQGDDSMYMTISSDESDAPTVVYPDLDQPVVGVLTGEGTHQIAVETFGGGDGSFTIETSDVGEGPGGS